MSHAERISLVLFAAWLGIIPGMAYLGHVYGWQTKLNQMGWKALYVPAFTAVVTGIVVNVVLP